MAPMTHIVLTCMALGRIAIGLAPFVAAGPSSRLLGFPSAHDNATARLMGRFFGVRDIGLGVLVLWALHHADALSFTLLFNAFMDLGDLFSTAIPLLRRQGIDRAAAGSALMASSAGVLWLVMWWIAR